jgi:integrase
VWKSFATRDEAELHLAQSKVMIKQGAFRQPMKIRFADFASEWLRDYAKGNVRERTFETYEAALRNHVIPHFGDLYLTQITRKLIDVFVADWSAGGPHYQERLQLARELEERQAREERRDPRPVRLGRAAGTISNALTPLREMLGHAVEWEYLAANPAAGVRRPRVEHHEMQILDGAQIRTLLDGIDKRGEPFVRKECRTFLLCAATTGMRLGELLALRWGDVDWQNRRLWVRRSITRNGTVQEPKTRGSMWAIAITPTLLSALREHRMARSFKSELAHLLHGEGDADQRSQSRPTCVQAGASQSEAPRHPFPQSTSLLRIAPDRAGRASEADLRAARARKREDHNGPLRAPDGSVIRRRERPPGRSPLRQRHADRAC